MEYRDIAVKTEVEEQIKANPKIISQIKTERGLAEYFRVSRTTVRRALNDLRMESDAFQEDHHFPNHTVFEMNMLKMSSFSNDSELYVNEAIKHLNITRIIIAHRETTIASADRIIKLN